MVWIKKLTNMHYLIPFFDPNSLKTYLNSEFRLQDPIESIQRPQTLKSTQNVNKNCATHNSASTKLCHPQKFSLIPSQFNDNRFTFDIQLHLKPNNSKMRKFQI